MQKDKEEGGEGSKGRGVRLENGERRGRGMESEGDVKKRKKRDLEKEGRKLGNKRERGEVG